MTRSSSTDDRPSRRRDLAWRKFYPHWWDQPYVERFTLRQKAVWAFLLTGPQANRIGYYRLRPGHAALTLGMPEPEFREDIQKWLLASDNR